MKPSLKPLKPVLVEWSDILDGGPEWHPHDGDQLKPVRVKTTGYLLSVSKKHIVIVRDYFDAEGKRTLGGRLAIPTGCIERILYLTQTDTKPAIS
jgi:hypothetical protein